MIKLDTPVQFIKGVGPRMAPRLRKLGLKTVRSLLLYFPRDWIDFSNISPISQSRVGQQVIIKAQIVQIKNERTFRKRMVLTSAQVSDKSGEMNLLWFNQPFLTNSFRIGEEWIFSGKVEYDFKNHGKSIIAPVYEKEERILPVYPETKGLTSRYLRKIIKPLLSSNLIKEFLPNEIKKTQQLIDFKKAIQEIHFPKSREKLNQAKKRLAFDELFLMILRMLSIKKDLAAEKAPEIAINKNLLKKFVDSLPYKLTNAQRKAAWEIINNLTKPTPMNRLLEGDVGSGKTVIAAMAALVMIKAGYRVVWMAPTEILACQHYENVMTLLKPFGITMSLLTGSNTKISEIKNLHKSQLKARVQNSNLIIGTHSLTSAKRGSANQLSADQRIADSGQDSIKFANLGLVIIDEQHRFGVRQRAALRSNKLKSNELIPHFLSMTATPIPRTLALSLYGDLDISILDEMPSGRAKTITRLVDPVNRGRAYEFIRDQVKTGRQVFVICPLIEEDKEENEGGKEARSNLFDLDRKSVKSEYEKLSKEIFLDFRIAMLHGKMKSKEKEQIMRDFRDKKLDIIVSTSVVEVGVDVPNASVMMIENAERFGLAQLHQFRGRVGRGGSQSYCLLFTDSLSMGANRRLKALVDCNDGFKLAEKDLEIRGPGELSGINQHGLPDLKMASLTDIILIKRARSEAERIVADDLQKFPDLVEKLEEFETTRHLE